MTVTINANGVFINNAKVTVADVVADNGVVHVIDAVLLPSTSVKNAEPKPLAGLFPNPTRDHLFLSQLSEEGAYFRVVSSNGRLMLEGTVAQSQAIDTSDLPSGTYFIEVRDERATQIGKFSKI